MPAPCKGFACNKADFAAGVVRRAFCSVAQLVRHFRAKARAVNDDACMASAADEFAHIARLDIENQFAPSDLD